MYDKIYPSKAWNLFFRKNHTALSKGKVIHQPKTFHHFFGGIPAVHFRWGGRNKKPPLGGDFKCFLCSSLLGEAFWLIFFKGVETNQPPCSLGSLRRETLRVVSGLTSQSGAGYQMCLGEGFLLLRDPWDERYIYLHEEVDFYGKRRKYTLHW